MLGKIGERLQVTANYDTEATFDFQNIVKLDYTPTEDDILQKIEVGNVNMPLNSSLIHRGTEPFWGKDRNYNSVRPRLRLYFPNNDHRTIRWLHKAGVRSTNFH